MWSARPNTQGCTRQALRLARIAGERGVQHVGIAVPEIEDPARDVRAQRGGSAVSVRPIS